MSSSLRRRSRMPQNIVDPSDGPMGILKGAPVRLFRRRPAGSALPALVTELGLAEILAESPASLLVIDREGTIVYRNAAALAVAMKVAERLGNGIIEQLRVGLRRAISE